VTLRRWEEHPSPVQRPSKSWASQTISEHLAGAAENEHAMLDSTIVRCAGAPKLRPEGQSRSSGARRRAAGYDDAPVRERLAHAGKSAVVPPPPTGLAPAGFENCFCRDKQSRAFANAATRPREISAPPSASPPR
jgi:hypothetical protein